MQARVFKVLVAGDDERIRSALTFFLDSFDDLVTIGEAASPAQTVELWTQLHPDVVLIDFSESEQDWIDVIRQIAQSDRHPQIVALIGSLNVALAREVLQAGAAICLQRGFVTIDGIIDALYTAVRQGNIQHNGA